MHGNNVKSIVLRYFSVFLMIFSIVFGVTWKKNGYCFGDEVLRSIGLKAWSNGTQGTHYTAIYALILLMFAFYFFAITTKKKDKTFRYFIIGSIAVVVCINLLALAI